MSTRRFQRVPERPRDGRNGLDARRRRRRSRRRTAGPATEKTGAAPPSASPARSVAPSTASSASPPNSACSATSRAGEIAGQVVAVLDRHAVRVGRDRVNLVFMGMGEPFLNYDNFMAAVRLLVREVGLSPQRMTVSTSGIVPGIRAIRTGTARRPPQAGHQPQRAQRRNSRRDHAHQSQVAHRGSDRRCAPHSAAPARAHHLRICSARRRHRPPGARPRTCAPRAPHRPAGESKSDRLESRPRHRLRNAQRRVGRRVSSGHWRGREFRSTCASRAAATSSPPAASSSAPSKPESKANPWQSRPTSVSRERIYWLGGIAIGCTLPQSAPL